MNDKLELLETKVVDTKLVRSQYKFENETFYVFVSNSMLWVAKVDWTELQQLIDDDKYEEYQAYDMTDEEAYFLDDEDLPDYIKEAITATLIAYIRRI